MQIQINERVEWEELQGTMAKEAGGRKEEGGTCGWDMEKWGSFISLLIKS